MKRRIAYVSGSRADFGLISPVLKAIKSHQDLTLQLYVTGMHLMEEFGNTAEDIKKEFPEAQIIDETFKSDDRAGMAEFIANFGVKILSVLKKDTPDFVLVQGDRVEMLAVAAVANIFGLPIAHTHGGDKTTTADETVRHAVTKLSHLHFPATDDSAERIKNLGEESWRINVVGAPGLDTVLNEQLPSRAELFAYLNIDPRQKMILVLQHPVTENIAASARQMQQTLEAVAEFNLPVVVIYSNADAGGREMIKVIEKAKMNPLFRIYPNLEYKTFLALEKEAAVWVGNSSGAIIESASFKTPVVNIGDRQNGRPQSSNVINTGYNKEEIKTAIDKSLNDKDYLKKLKKITNIWGDGHASERIVKVLSEVAIDSKLLNKQITY